jgi:Ca2+-binding EF-hand superfamily protein
MPQRTLIAVALPALLAVMLVVPAGPAQVPPPAAPQPPTQPPKADYTWPKNDVQDLAFFAATRPLLLRLHVQIDGKPFQVVWDDYLGKLFAYLDGNNDGVLSKEEAARAPRAQDLMNLVGLQFVFNGQPVNLARLEDMDANKDGKVTKEEFVAYYRSNGSSALRLINSGTRGNSEALTAALFKHLDLNKDGKLSRDELAQAPVSLARLDQDEDEMISREELSGTRSNPYYIEEVAVLETGRRPGMAPGAVVQLVNPGEPRQPLVQELLRRYDKDKNGKLSLAESGLDQYTFDALDANHDGQLDAKELVRWAERPVDLELILRLGNGSTKGDGLLTRQLVELSKMLGTKASAPLEVVKGLIKSPPLTERVKKTDENNLLLTLSDAKVTFTRGAQGGNADPNGLRGFFIRQFEQLDVGKKGYLEKKDLEQAQGRFAVNLFQFADRDGDGKLTKAEMLAALDLLVKGPPAQVQLSVADNGRGLFELIDGDGDGRLSVRELRTAWTRLAPWDRNGDGMLALDEVPQLFQVTVDQSQGGNRYFVPRMVGGGYRTAAPRGPLWFRKMDRNGDGDVSRKEFLGTEEEFQRMDLDGDGLISAEEAEKADAQLRPPPAKADKGKDDKAKEVKR